MSTEHATRDEIDEARSLYERDDVNIDDDALVSRADEGVWVQAWVWVPAPRYVNHYHCSWCGCEWQDEWDCTCNDRCPNCDAETEPHHSDEL